MLRVLSEATLMDLTQGLHRSLQRHPGKTNDERLSQALLDGDFRYRELSAPSTPGTEP